MSARESTAFALFRCSGAIYPSVPMTAPVRVMAGMASAWSVSRAMPKSDILQTPSPATRMLCGLTSRWMTPLACAAVIPAQLWMRTWAARRSGMGPQRSSQSTTEPFSHSSITMNGWLPSTPRSYTRTICGCSSRAIVWASDWNRWRRRARLPYSVESSLIARHTLSRWS